MAKILAPNKQYEGKVASVAFVKGEAETNDARLIEWFREHGYEVHASGAKEKNKPDEKKGGK